ncbi:hypothetical protein PIB30_056142 [Stylosanthes scabra]|uniref:Uncharacterized protein n=1 Tax=Stylosanthes scabra TaxID=79078 RepID=A0ABU6UMT5_9FABA|nr:hypothetical protein [Stylosanthes scabra]
MKNAYMSKSNVTHSLTMLTIGLGICFTIIIAEDETIPNKHAEEATRYYYIASTRRDLERYITRCKVIYLGSSDYGKNKSRENCIQECKERFQDDPEAFQNCRKECLSQFPQSNAEAIKECIDKCMHLHWRNRSRFLVCRKKCYDKYPITL